jgi:hypothetical protein
LDTISILADTAHQLRKLHSISMLWKLQIIEGSTVACIRHNDRYFLDVVFWWRLSLNATCLIMQRYGCIQNLVNPMQLPKLHLCYSHLKYGFEKERTSYRI